MCGHVVLDGLNGDVVVSQGPFAGVLVGVGVDKMSGKPVVLASVWVHPFLQVLIPVAVGLSCHADALDLFDGHVGEVDIQAGMRGKAVFQDFSDDDFAKVDSGGEVCVGRVVQKGQAHGGVGEGGLDGGADGAGVEHADGGVGAVVDAREDEVDLAVAQHDALAYLDTVHRGAVGAPVGHTLLLSVLPYMQRLIHGDGMAHGRPRLVGDHYSHLAKLFGNLDHGFQTGGLVAIVIDYQYEGLVCHYCLMTFVLWITCWASRTTRKYMPLA